MTMKNRQKPCGVAKKKISFCVMSYTNGAGIFVRMSAENELSRQILKMTAMKNDSQKNHYGKSGGFILCVFRTGLPRNSAKVGTVGKIGVVQWAAQAEPEFPLECLPET